MIRCFPKKYLEDNIKEYVKDTVLIMCLRTPSAKAKGVGENKRGEYIHMNCVYKL